MKLSKLASSVGLALVTTYALSAHAAINGYFDAVDVEQVDTMTGWICDSAAPGTAPPGDFVVYTGGPAGGGGTLYTNYHVYLVWGGYRPDVPAAGFCGTNNFTGFSMNGFLSYPVYLYYKFPNGTLQLLGGSPKTCNGQGLCF